MVVVCLLRRYFLFEVKTTFRGKTNGRVFWFTGLSGAGKSTLAEHAVQFLFSHKKTVQLLDGNEVRDFFENDLGFTSTDRDHAIKRVTFGSYLLAKNGIDVVVASIASTYSIRDFIRQKLGDMYVQIYVHASVEVVAERDPRGLYKAIRSGVERDLPGVSQNYDIPRSPHLTLDTSVVSVDESASELEHFLKSYV